jgi:peptidoglycan/xylan/chitin deacetylase (PgdA/CDA1 family)
MSLLLPCLAAAGLGAASLLMYGSLAPRSQLFGRTVFRLGDPRHVALTFDDGPNDPATLQLLDVLARHNARATFFAVGRYVRQRPDIVRDVIAAGHTVGNHTFSHANLAWCRHRRNRSELERCQRALEDATGRAPTLFRPPWGAREPVVLRQAHRLQLTPCMWSITGWDWRATTPAQIETRVARRLRGGSIVLLHDGFHRAFGADRRATVEAVNGLLGRFDGQFEFVAVPSGEAARP